MSLVTWVGTPREVAREMLRLAGVGPGHLLCDLGSGDGRLLLMAVREFGAARAVGYELREDLCRAVEQKVRRLGLAGRIHVANKNLQEADLFTASVIAMYLGTEANALLRPKLEKEARPGTRIVTYLFPIEGWRPVRELDLRAVRFRQGRFTGSLYLYIR